MKQEPNKEMDLLLRRLGRTVNSVPAGSGNGVAESSTEPVHLDADELNAYAENALPLAARARYTEHLAECTGCRQMVSQLSKAAGLVFNEPKHTSATESWFKALLASLLSPIVLRYAVPALGLLVVASIGFFVLRDSSSSKHVAESLQERPATSVAALDSKSTNENVSVDQQKQVDHFIEPKQAQSRGLADQNKAGEESTKSGDQEARPEPTILTDRLAAAPTNASTGTGAAPAAAATKPGVADDQKQKAADVAQRQQPPATEAQTVDVAKANEEAPAKRPPKEAASAVQTFSGISAVGRAKTDSAKKVAGEKSEEEKGARERDRADKDSPEITSVAGRRFRKDGSVWIDVAYSSQATTNIKRGSEQYRALVADEPGIRTIAEQLSGEVIVVWKGRAYRIR